MSSLSRLAPLDCIYCQLGRTTNKTIERREWVPLEEVVDELRDKLALGPDYVTIGGSGEPTLYSRIGELIDRIRSIKDIPIAVLTNGSLLWKQDVRNDLRKAHVVIPSLDVGENVLFPGRSPRPTRLSPLSVCWTAWLRSGRSSMASTGWRCCSSPGIPQSRPT